MAAKRLLNAGCAGLPVAHAGRLMIDAAHAGRLITGFGAAAGRFILLATAALL